LKKVIVGPCTPHGKPGGWGEHGAPVQDRDLDWEAARARQFNLLADGVFVSRVHGYSSCMAGFVRDALLPLFLLCTTLPLGAQALATAPTESGVALSFPTNEQLRRFKSMSGPRLAPDGKRILLSITEATADGAKSHLWLTGAGGEEPRQITYSPDADKRGEYEASWMPDGQSILFLAKRDEHISLYRCR